MKRCLDAVVRNDVLRISIPAGTSRFDQAADLQNEFIAQLETHPGARTVIIDVPSPEPLDPSWVRLLDQWQRIAALAGCRIRLNGLSELVNRGHHTVRNDRGVRFHLHTACSQSASY